MTSVLKRFVFLQRRISPVPLLLLFALSGVLLCKEVIRRLRKFCAALLFPKKIWGGGPLFFVDSFIFVKNDVVSLQRRLSSVV